MSNPIVVTGGNVEGDITSCKIENQLLSVKREGALSYTQETTYITYDVCNKAEIARYTTPELSVLGGLSLLAAVVLVVVLIAAWVDRY